MNDVQQATLFGAGAALLGGVVGGLLSGAYQHGRDYFTRPQLGLDFDLDTDKVEASWPEPYAFDGLILRVRLRNNGKRTAQGCQVFVTGLMEKHQSGDVMTNFLDSRQTPWAGWFFAARAVPRGIDFYSDFLRISKTNAGWMFPFERSIAGDKSLRNFRGTYQVRLTAVADNADPYSITVAVSYDGDWRSVRAWRT